MYIKDLIRITDWFINNKPQHKVYNVCSGDVQDYQGIAEKINSLSNKNLSIDVFNDGLGVEYSGDNTRLLEELKDFEFTPINESLNSMINWFENNKEKIDEVLFEY